MTVGEYARVTVRKAETVEKIVLRQVGPERFTLLLPKAAPPGAAWAFIDGWRSAGQLPPIGMVTLVRMGAEQSATWAAALHVPPPRVEVRRVEGCWGLCRMAEGLILLNPALADVPACAAEAVLLHEVLHLRYPQHNSPFWREMTRLLPDWPWREGVLRGGGTHGIQRLSHSNHPESQRQAHGDARQAGRRGL